MLIDNTHFFEQSEKKPPDNNLAALINTLTNNKIIPVFSGNFIPTKQGKFWVLSSDALTLMLARLIRPKRVIFLSDVDGVLDRSQEVIPLFDRSMLNKIASSPNDVSGGMKTKITTALEILAFCKDCIVANGLKKGVLKGLLKCPERKAHRWTDILSDKYVFVNIKAPLTSGRD